MCLFYDISNVLFLTPIACFRAKSTLLVLIKFVLGEKPVGREQNDSVDTAFSFLLQSNPEELLIFLQKHHDLVIHNPLLKCARSRGTLHLRSRLASKNDFQFPPTKFDHFLCILVIRVSWQMSKASDGPTPSISHLIALFDHLRCPLKKQRHVFFYSSSLDARMSSISLIIIWSGLGIRTANALGESFVVALTRTTYFRSESRRLPWDQQTCCPS